MLDLLKKMKKTKWTQDRYKNAIKTKYKKFPM